MNFNTVLVDESNFFRIMMAMSEGVQLSNEAYAAKKSGRYQEAIDKYERSLEVKLKAYGENSVHVCINLSGLADAYLKLGEIDKAEAFASRYMKIAEAIKNSEQLRIAKEIQVDIVAAKKALKK